MSYYTIHKITTYHSAAEHPAERRRYWPPQQVVPEMKGWCSYDRISKCQNKYMFEIV